MCLTQDIDPRVSNTASLSPLLSQNDLAVYQVSEKGTIVIQVLE